MEKYYNMNKSIVKALEWGFRLAYLLLGVASFHVFLYDSPVQPVLVKLCMVLGILTLAGRLLFFRSYISTPYWWVLALFCVSFLITIVVNRQYGAAGTDFKWLIWTGMLFFLLYMCDMDREINEYKKEFKVFSHILIICSFLSSAASLYLLSQFYHAKWYTASGELMLAGFQWGRLWGVYTDPNYGAVFSVVVILLCIYYCKILKTWRKIPYVIVIILNYGYIVFSDSRTAEVAMVVSVIFWILFTAVQKKENIKGISICIIASVFFAVMFVGGTSYVKTQYNVKIQQQINAMDAAEKNTANKSNVNNNTQNKSQTQQQVGRAADLQKDVTNGRLALWESGVEVWKNSPIFGVGYNSFIPYAIQNLPQTYAVNNSQGTNYVSMHNEFINILAYHGIVGLGIFLIFTVLVFVTWIKTVRKIKDEDRDYMVVLTACVLTIGVAMIFLLEGMHTNSPGTFILWTFTGYIMHYCTKIRKAEE